MARTFPPPSSSVMESQNLKFFKWEWKKSAFLFELFLYSDYSRKFYRWIKLLAAHSPVYQDLQWISLHSHSLFRRYNFLAAIIIKLFSIGAVSLNFVDFNGKSFFKGNNKKTKKKAEQTNLQKLCLMGEVT